MADHKERAQQLAEDWHEGVPQKDLHDWCCRAAGLLLHFSRNDRDPDGVDVPREGQQ